MNDPLEDANSSIVIEVSTPQNEMVAEEISSLKDEQENSCDLAEVVKVKKWFNLKKKLDNSHNEEKLDKIEILSQDWLMNHAQQLEAYGDHHEGISRMIEEFLKMHVEQSQEVELFEIAIRKLETELNAKIEACDAQYQRAMDCSFELVSNEEEVKIDFHELMDQMSGGIADENGAKLSKNRQNAANASEHMREIWDSLEKKYGDDDAGKNKYVVGQWIKFQMVDNKPIMEQVHEYENLTADLLTEGMKMCEIFQANVLLEKFPPFWSDYRNQLKHKKKDLTLQELTSHMRTEEVNRLKDKMEALSLNSHKANLVETSSTVVKDKFKGKQKKVLKKGNGKKKNHFNKLKNQI
ncbi:uncharacterized protein LOC132057733 [Lycium ferocissimum]|uniref:uncharacterized protein LOC132057733 n=1 Tax=Lycium ferocissimum TaxID=112874 RepID=UPI00281683C2|nr:uncharacterized protein LOC132057733 [Lycium ferocissimum]